MTTLNTTLNNPQGLHARPATLFCKEASAFKSDIKLVCGDKEGNAKSLIALLAMGLTAGATAKHMADFIANFRE